MSRTVMGMRVNNAGPAQKTHLVADIHFEHKVDSSLAPIICACGWQGTVAEWTRHSGGSVMELFGKPGWAGPGYPVLLEAA